MSYTKNYSLTIRVPYDFYVEYPASEHGGSKHVSGHVEEDVHVEIDVDTAPFDHSVEACNEQVNGLTASVTAMDAAQCASIHANSKKVAKSVVAGFFSTVRSDISAQHAQLKQAVDARLMLLRQQALSLQKKQKEMEANYARTSSRYIKLFDDLNRELETRVHQIDQPVFRIVADIDNLSSQMLAKDLIPTISATSAETDTLQAQISAAATRHHAQQALSQMYRYLQTHAETSQTIHNTSINGVGNEIYYVPVCYVESIREDGLADKQVYSPTDVGKQAQNRLQQSIGANIAESPSQLSTQRQLLQAYLQNEVERNVSGNDVHTQRIRDYIYKLFNEDK